MALGRVGWDMCISDRSGREGAGAGEPPVSRKPALNVFFVDVPVDIIIQHQTRLEPEEPDQGNFCKHKPRKPPIGHGRQQVTGTEQERPGKEKLQPKEVDICPQGRIHHYTVRGAPYFTFSQTGYEKPLYHLSHPKERDGIIFYPAGTSRRYRRNF
jgi:hypothetical protein